MNIRLVSPEHGDISVTINDRTFSFNNVIDFFISVLIEVDDTRSIEDVEKHLTLSTSNGIYISNLYRFSDNVDEVYKGLNVELVASIEDNHYVRRNYFPNLSMFSNMREHSSLVTTLRRLRRVEIENRDIITQIIDSYHNRNVSPFFSISGTDPVSLARDHLSIFEALGIPLFDNVEVRVLSQAEFDKLPVKIWQEKVKTGESGEDGESDEECDKCVVCQNDFCQDEDVVTLPCEHEFHKDCIQTWLTQNSCKCPMCRFTIDASSTANMEVEHIISVD